MAEQSQKEEMNAAIRAHRERHNVPRSIAPEPLQPVDQGERQPPRRQKGFLSRLFGR